MSEKQTFYRFTYDTKEYVGEEVDAKGAISISSCTKIKPLDSKDGYGVCFNEEKQKWEYLVDNRNKIYYLNGIKVEFKLGDEVTTDMSLEQYTVAEKLEFAKQAKLSELFSTYQKEDTTPIVIDGVTWKSGEESYLKFFNSFTIDSNLGETSTKFYDVNDKEYILTIDEAKSIATKVGKSHRELFTKYSFLCGQVKALNIIEEVESVVWAN